MASVVFAGAIVIAISALFSRLIQSVVTRPYMDEIFHVPQSRHYCDSNWTHWDPMITTLPGLYLSSVALLFPLASVQGLKLLDVCTVQNLRACNQVFTLGNFLLLYSLTKNLHESLQYKRSQMRKVLNAAVLTIFPVSYFFTWLHYTDPGATFFTLLMYLLCLHGQYKYSAIFGAVAIIFRQTNIIWVLFCIALVKIDTIEKHIIKMNKLAKIKLNDMKDLEVAKLLIKLSFSFSSSTLTFYKNILCSTFWYLCIVVSFAVFVYVNKGIVVGDRSNHTVSYNFPHVFYFLMISGAFSFVHIAQPKQILNFMLTMFKNPVKMFFFLAISAFLVKSFTYEHKYILSDNRHYNFYVWSKIFRRHELARYAMLPVYLYSLYQFYVLTVHKGFMWRLSVIFCIMALLIPQALFEFRYYIIPFYILRLNMKLPSTKALFLELIFYSVINVITVYMFVNKPFFWPNDPAAQRFMW